MQTFQCLCESVVFWICTVVCLHRYGEVRHFGTLKCIIHYKLIWCKNYQNPLIFEKVIAKSLVALFHGPQCILHKVFKYFHNIFTPLIEAALLFISEEYLLSGHQRQISGLTISSHQQALPLPVEYTQTVLFCFTFAVQSQQR